MKNQGVTVSTAQDQASTGIALAFVRDCLRDNPEALALLDGVLQSLKNQAAANVREAYQIGRDVEAEAHQQETDPQNWAALCQWAAGELDALGALNTP